MLVVNEGPAALKAFDVQFSKKHEKGIRVVHRESEQRTLSINSPKRYVPGIKFVQIDTLSVRSCRVLESQIEVATAIF
jgi:hypothetical protein